MEGKIRIQGATERNRDMHCEQNKRVKYEKREILGVSDVICSICTEARLIVICSTRATDFIRQNRASRVGQFSGSYLLNSNIPESKWMAETVIKEISVCG